MTKKKPLTLEEISEAADQFFPLFEEVHRRMPDGSTTEDSLKVMEAVAKLGHINRAEKPGPAPFGFNKKPENGDPENTTKH